jgi:hypothetical protein
MILSEVLAVLGEVLAFALPTGLSGVAAYYAYKQYNRRPQLKFYLQNGEYDPVTYDTGSGIAYVECWLANEGKVAAHNIHGWLEYGDDPEAYGPKMTSIRGLPTVWTTPPPSTWGG